MNRRDFLQAGALGGLVLPASGVFAAYQAEKKPRVGLIGTGWYGKCDLFRLIQVAPVEVVSLCDVDKVMLADAASQVASRQASKKTPRTYTDYRKMLAEKDLDIVLVDTPDHWHALPMIAAMEAGADVWVQKPISIDVTEGQAMVDAARKLKKVVQVGTQRRSTPHLIEARDNIIREGKLGKIGLVEIYCYYHMRSGRTDARHRPRPRTSTTRCGPARRRCGRTTRSSTPGAGGRSWSTATGSWATCASTCSTWSAGCSTSAGRTRSPRPAESWSTRRAGRTSPTPRKRPSTSATSRSSGSTGVGAPPPTRRTSGARRSTATKGPSRPTSCITTSSPREEGRSRSTSTSSTNSTQYPEDRTEKDLERHVAPAIRGHMRDFLACIASRGKPVADIEEGHISTASCILANNALKLGRTLAYDPSTGKVKGDDEATRLLTRPYRSPWVHPAMGRG